VVGPQQQYLENIEARMFEEGDLYRERHRFSPAVTIGDKSVDEVDEAIYLMMMMCMCV